MKYIVFLFVLMFTFAVNTMGQAPRNLYNKPLNELTSTQTRCLAMGFGLDQFGYCMKERQLPWIAYGGGWSSTFRWSNTKMDDTAPGGVSVCFILMGLDGKGGIQNGRNTANAYLRSNRSPSVYPVGVAQYPLMPKESVEAEFMYPASYDASAPPYFSAPDPDRLAVGSLWVIYIAREPEHLLGLVPSSLSFYNRNAQGSVSWNATEDELEAAPYLGSQFSETFILEGRGQDFKITSAAVANPTDFPIFVDITLHNQDGGFVTTGRIFLLKNETRGFLFREIFPDNRMFPGGKDLTGTVTFEVTASGVINPGPRLCVATVFQRVGDSMGNLKVYPVTRP